MSVRKKYELPFDDYFLFAYHPVTTELDTLPDDIDACVAALEESGENFVVIYPNNDRGSERIFEAYRKLEENPRFKFYPSLRFEYFLMKRVYLIVFYYQIIRLEIHIIPKCMRISQICEVCQMVYRLPDHLI